MIETNFIREYKNAFDSQDCLSLIDFFDATLSNGSIAIAKGAEDTDGGHMRYDETIYLEKTKCNLINKITHCVETCWLKYSEEFPFLQKQGIISYTQKMQKTKPMGGFHNWHWEHNSLGMNRNRMAVWTLYLTDHEDEGETEFLAHGLKVKPEKGKFCIFPADYTAVHRGNPVYSKDKYIVTGWYEYN